MKNKKLSPVTEQSEQVTAYAAGERTNPGFTPQCSAMTGNKSSAQTNRNDYFYHLAQLNNAVGLQTDPCFLGHSFDLCKLSYSIPDRILLATNQKYFLYEVMRNNFSFILSTFLNPEVGVEVDVFIISRFTTFGQMGEFLDLNEEEQSKHPDMKEFCEPWKGLLRPLGRGFDDVILTECMEDVCFDDGTIMYPKGTIIATIAEDPFPKVSEPNAYRELLDPDNYGAPHDVLDFVNEKLHEAYPQFNLWCIALDLDFLHIFNLDKLPYTKMY